MMIPKHLLQMLVMEKRPAKIDNGRIDYSPNLKMETFSEKNLNNSMFEKYIRPIKIGFANSVK